VEIRDFGPLFTPFFSKERIYMSFVSMRRFRDEAAKSGYGCVQCQQHGTDSVDPGGGAAKRYGAAWGNASQHYWMTHRHSVTLQCRIVGRPCFDKAEAVEQPERQRWYGEEVESDDYLTMVLEKCLPALPCTATPPYSPPIASDRRFRDLEAELPCYGYPRSGPKVRRGGHDFLGGGT
jgi:hypothetical protein